MTILQDISALESGQSLDGIVQTAEVLSGEKGFDRMLKLGLTIGKQTYDILCGVSFGFLFSQLDSINKAYAEKVFDIFDAENFALDKFQESLDFPVVGLDDIQGDDLQVPSGKTLSLLLRVQNGNYFRPFTLHDLKKLKAGSVWDVTTYGHLVLRDKVVLQ